MVKRTCLARLTVGVIAAFGLASAVLPSVVAAEYSADWDSLTKHDPAPEWFRDAKFGIYFHWGVYSVPAFGSEWYPRNMHIKKNREYKHHVETYGDPTEFGYADFVPKFRAEKFDADEWAALFEKAGARFAGPVAEHHDGFAMWDSALTPWNATDMGPRRDITGELAKAVRKRGMKLVATFHHARNNLWQKDGNWTGHYQYVKQDFPSLLENPKEAVLYGYMPRDKFVEMWRGKLFEVIDNYRPDLIWFDSWLHEIPEKARREFCAYYLNRADEWGKDVVITRKQDDLPLEFTVLDLEKGRMNKLTENAWLTDDTISLGSWCYTQDLRIKPLRQVLHVLIDIVSKNGQLLLNISPKADGTIPAEQRDVLLGIGAWLDTCGQAIYETRPWIAFGEGPTRLKRGGGFTHRQGGYLQYGAEDVRFTRSKDGGTLYAITLGWPDDGKLRVQSLGKSQSAVGRIRSVELIGHTGRLEWSRDEDGLTVELPNTRPCENAFALRIKADGVMNGYDLATGQKKKDPHIAEQLAEIDQVNAAGKWKTNWDSLTRHDIPEWFQDAKFGIYAHLGVYCVPAFGTEWYPRKMYQTQDAVYKHHIKTYGDPSEFGYKDFIPMFKLAKFDPAEWAQLYQDAGAKFAGPVAEHHDGFSMWASQVNRWNAGNMGPKRDIAGELIAELRKRNMRIITSFHHAFNVQGYYTPKEAWDTGDPQYADLYGFPTMEDRTLARDRWLLKLKEVIDAYRPDQIWFDFGLAKVPDEYKQKMAAYYYNHEAIWGKQVIITRKGDHLPEGVGALDIERGWTKGIGEQLWQTDDSTARNSWSWVRGLDVKPTVEMVHELIDIVSKNGVLLLNVCPKADGTISPDQQQTLREMGKWLKVCGEAIYEARPWETFGEGPTRQTKSGSFLKADTYTAQDVRYTRSKDGKALYAILMGWPDNDVTLRFVQVNRARANAKIELIGHRRSLRYRINDKQQPVITMPKLAPDQRPCRYAYALKLSGFAIEPSPDALFMSENAVTLTAEKAVLDGDKINTEKKGSRTNIGFWDDPKESVHWLVRIGAPGVHMIRGEFAATGASRLRLRVGDKQVRFDVPATGSWNRSTQVDVGRLRFEAPGIYHAILEPANPNNWRAVNVWQLQLAPAR